MEVVDLAAMSASIPSELLESNPIRSCVIIVTQYANEWCTKSGPEIPAAPPGGVLHIWRLVAGREGIVCYLLSQQHR